MSFSAGHKLILFTVVVTVQQGIRGLAGTVTGGDLGLLLWQFGMPLLLVAWLREDYKRTHYWPCSDYDFFAFAAWPVVIPHYLFHTRGVRGLGLCVLFLVLFFVPRFIMALIYVLSH